MQAYLKPDIDPFSLWEKDRMRGLLSTLLAGFFVLTPALSRREREQFIIFFLRNIP